MSLNDNTENQLENGETQEVNENIVSSEVENNTEDNQNDSEMIPADETNAELDDTEESNADIDEENSKAKKHKNRTLVVAASIFAVTALSFGAWYAFFNNDVSGVWATDVDFTDNSGNTKTAVMKFEFGNKEKMSFFDNEKSYFSDKESNSPSAKMINGGRSWSGWYNKTTSDANENILQLYFSAYQSPYSYNYEVSGNIFSGRTLKLINGDEVMKFTQADNSYALDPDDDFKLNNGVVGEWNADGNIVYTFTKDGRFSEDTGNSKTEGTYNFGESDDGYDAIIVKYMYNGEVNTITIPYLLKGDTMTLTFNGYDVDLTKVVK